jgi:hypothetical protein
MSLLSAASPETGRKSTDETPSSHGSADIHVAPAGRETSVSCPSSSCSLGNDGVCISLTSLFDGYSPGPQALEPLRYLPRSACDF